MKAWLCWERVDALHVHIRGGDLEVLEFAGCSARTLQCQRLHLQDAPTGGGDTDLTRSFGP